MKQETSEEKIILTKEEYKSLLDRTKRQPLIYDSFDKWDNLESLEVFSDKQILVCFDTLENCAHYPHHIQGEWTKRRDISILSLLTFCGLRPGEACSLRFDDYVSAEDCLLIRPENNKQKRGRKVPLPKQAKKYISNYLKMPKYIWANSEFLFPSFENKQKPLSSRTWKYIMREKILKPSGLWVAPTGNKNNRVPKFRSYSFRHSF